MGELGLMTDRKLPDEEPPTLRSGNDPTASFGLGHPLIERQRELAVLVERMNAAKGGAGSVVTIEGPAGIGKTSLIRAAGELARRTGLTTAVGRAAPIEAHLPHSVVRQLLEPLLSKTTPDERRMLLVGSAEPAAAVFPGMAHASPPAVERPGVVAHALCRLTVHFARTTPLLLCIDDAHFSDGPSLRFLAHLFRRIEDLPVLAVVAVRSGERPVDAELFLDLLTGPTVEALEPQPLTTAGVGSLVQAELEAPVEPAFAHACRQATGGNPFLVHELASALDADGIEPRAESAGQVAGLSPNLLSQAIAVRLARLPGPTLELARAVAVLGDRAPLHLAAELAGLELPVASQIADRLSAAEILLPRRTMGSSRELGFVHPLVRTTLEKGIGEARQRVAHARAAQLLARHGVEPARIAGHLLQTDPEGESSRIPVLRQAAAQAMRRGSPATAIAYLRRALAEGVTHPRAEMLLELGVAEARSGMPEASGTLGSAVEAACTGEELAAAAREHGRLLMVSNEVRQALAVAAQAIARLEDRPDLIDVLEEEQLLGILATSSVLTRLHEHLQQVPPGGDELSARHRLILAVAALEQALTGGSTERAASHAVRALGDGRLLALVGPEDLSVHVATLALSLAGRIQRARHESSNALALAEELGSVAGVAFGSAVRGWCAWRAGSLEDAEVDARRALDLPMPAQRWGLLRPMAVATLAETLVERGRTDEAEAVIIDRADDADASESLLWGLVLVARGRLRASQRRFTEAVADFREADRHQRSWGVATSGITAWSAHCVDALVHLGRRDDARAIADRELVRARRFAGGIQVATALRSSARAAADDTAVDLLREAVVVLAPSESRLELARALIELGAALRRTGQRSAGRRYLGQGLEISDACGAEVLLQRARYELEASGATLGREAVVGPSALTPSERRVATLAASGLTNREIAQSLLISPSTVEVHLTHVYRKLGVNSRRKLARALAADDQPTTDGD